MHVIQDRSVGNDEIYTINELEHILAYSDHQNNFKDETCTYCNKKGDIDTLCFSKRDDEKLSKLAEKCTAYNKEEMDSILNGKG